MLVYIIPVGGGNNVFKLLHSYSYDGNLISEGIAFLINAVLLLFASLKLAKKRKRGTAFCSCSACNICSCFFRYSCIRLVFLRGCSMHACYIRNKQKNSVQIFYKFKRTCSSRTRYYRNCCLCYLHKHNRRYYRCSSCRRTCVFCFKILALCTQKTTGINIFRIMLLQSAVSVLS